MPLPLQVSNIHVAKRFQHLGKIKYVWSSDVEHLVVFEQPGDTDDRLIDSEDSFIPTEPMEYDPSEPIKVAIHIDPDETFTFALARSERPWTVSQMPVKKLGVYLTDRSVEVDLYDTFRTFAEFGNIIFMLDRPDYTLIRFTRAAAMRHARKGTEPLSPPPPDHQSPLHILNALPDECLIAVFERLDVRGLYTMANVCKHFRRLAVYVFRKRYRGRYFAAADLRQRRRPVALSLLVNFLRIFAPTSVAMAGGSPAEEDCMYGAMAAYCRSLEALDVLDMQSSVAVLWPLLPQLKTLKMFADYFDDAATTSAEWQTEELHLSIGYEDLDVFLPNVRMPALATLAFYDFDAASFDALHEFLTRNGRVKALTFVRCAFSWSVLCELLECTANTLEALTLDDTKFSYEITYDRRPAAFERVHKLQLLHMEDFHLYERLLSDVPIDHLELDGRIGDQTVRALCRMRATTSLKVTMPSGISDDYLVRLVRSMRSLRKLHLVRANISLDCVKHVLTDKSATFADLTIELDAVDFVAATCNEISALVAGQPERRVRLEIVEDKLKVSAAIYCGAFLF